MIAYHIDRENKLHREQKVQLEKLTSPDKRFQSYMEGMFPQGISVAGRTYISNLEFDKDKDWYQRVKEIDFEYIRRLNYPQKPSRFQCFFALEYQDIDVWVNTFHLNEGGKPYKIWKVSIDNEIFVSRHDVSFRDRYYYVHNNQDRRIYTAWEYHMDGIEYWDGKISSDPLPELLVPLDKCKVIIIEPLIFPPAY